MYNMCNVSSVCCVHVREREREREKGQREFLK